MNKMHFKLVIGIMGIGIFLTALITFFSYIHSSPIESYNAERDREKVFKLFEENWHWLTAISKENINEYLHIRFDKQVPTESPKDMGKLITKVYRENNGIAGFVSYYMETPIIGKILFLAVEKESRGKGIAKALLQHALYALHKDNARVVRILTRSENNPALKLYYSRGFHKSWEQEGFIGLQYRREKQPETRRALIPTPAT